MKLTYRPRGAAGGVPHTGGQIALLLLKLYGLWLLVCLLGRAAMFAWQHSRLGDLSATTQAMAFVYGWRMDTILLSYLLAPVVLVLTLWPRPLPGVAAWSVRA